MNDFAPAPEYARLAQAGITIRTVALAASHAGAQASTPSPASPPPAGRATADAENELGEDLRWVLATEQPARVFDWERWDLVDEVLLIDGLRPAGKQIPLLDSHNRSSASDLIGSVVLDGQRMVKNYNALMGRVRFSQASELARETAAKVAEGHLTDGSIGYRVLKSVWIPEGESAQIRGKIYNGPLKVSTKAELLEFSITPIGADNLAKVRGLKACASRN